MHHHHTQQAMPGKVRHACRDGRDGVSKGKGDLGGIQVLFVILTVVVLWTDMHCNLSNSTLWVCKVYL